MTRYIALDTETTGLSDQKDRITELAAVGFDPATGNLTGETYHTFLNPEQEIPPEVSKVHGKTWNDLKDEPLFRDKCEEFLAFVKGAEIVIHNANFDTRMLNSELARLKLKSFDTHVSSITDTLAISRKNIAAKSHTLDSLCRRFGIDKSARILHGALIDCELLAAVYPKLIEEAFKRINSLNGILPFKLNEPIEPTLEASIEKYLALSSFIKILESEQKRHKDQVQKLTKGIEFETDEYMVEFSNRTNTNWEKITKLHLKDVNLAQFQTSSAAMSIKFK